MPSDPDFQPLYSRTEEDIRAAINAYVNQGIDPDDDRFVDTREGSMFYIITQPLVIQLALVWDQLGTEVGASAYLQTAWGDKLDLAAGEYGIERKAATYATGEVTFTAGPTPILLGEGFAVGVEQTDPDIDPPEYETTASGTVPAGGTLTLPIQAVEDGIDSNVAAGAITLPIGNAPGLVSVTNADPIAGGADVESDIDLRVRALTELAFGKGSGTQADYVRWSLSEPGVGRATCVPVWNGPGTVLVIITSAEGDAVSSAVIDSLQARLDPVPGQGKGLAPIDHEVTVVTPATVGVTVHADVTPEAGYTVAGLQTQIDAALSRYIDSLQAGDDVIAEHVQAMFFEVKGVYTVGPVTLNALAPGADLAISFSPPQVAQFTASVLT